MQNTFKKIIIILTIIVLIGGVYFGITFYNKSQNPVIDVNGKPVNTDPGRTPFQTRVSTSTGVTTIIEENNTVNNPTQTTSAQVKPRLAELWKEPVSGFDFVYKDIEVVSTSTSNSTSTVIASIVNKRILKNQEHVYLWDRKTGHIYENLASTTELEKISNYTLPGVEEAFFGDSTTVVARKLEDDNDAISTKYLRLIKEFSTSTVYRAEMRDINIDSSNVSFNSGAKKLFYFLNKTGKGVVSSLDGTVRTSVLNTTISEWLSQYVNKTLIGLVTKPSAYFKGYLFTLNPDGGAKNSYILGEKYGFNALISPDGRKVIYNEILNNTLETFIYDIRSKSNTYLSQATIVDKCTWSTDSKKIYCGIPQRLVQAPYPDAWYMNDIEFSDNIWSIDAATGDFSLVVALQDQVLAPIDVYKIIVSNTGRYLLFQDKNTLNLWKYDLIVN